MTKASDQRIRHVAIVLQSLDATTSRGLLGQLPPAQSKLVRQAMVRLGTVTPQERAAAFQSMQGLLNASAAKTNDPHQAKNEILSPAAALAASQKTAIGDHFEWSPEAINQQENQLGNPFGESKLSMQVVDGSWQNMPPAALANILQGERPIVIATVLNQVSVERATVIVQALPIQVAAATLGALPHLYLTDPAILRDIQSEVERKIGQYQAPKLASEEGITKLQAIVANMPKGQQENWTRAIAQSNPVLASKLGWSSDARLPQSNSAVSNAGISPTVGDSQKDASSKSNRSVESGMGDIFDDSMILPFPQQVSVLSKSDSTEMEQIDAPHLPNDTHRKPLLDDLLQFSDKDFVTVLHACQPQSVLLALSGATKAFVDRVERLMPAKDVKRLRDRLNSLGPIQLRDVDAAQTRIAEQGLKMLAKGEVGATASVSFTAAA